MYIGSKSDNQEAEHLLLPLDKRKTSFTTKKRHVCTNTTEKNLNIISLLPYKLNNEYTQFYLF
jgi:hypothetical protein